MKKLLTITALIAFSALAVSSTVQAETEDFSQFQMPVSNPVYHGDARNVTMIRPVFLQQSLPDKIDTINGDMELGGDMTGIAVQLSYAFNERFSFVAAKDGYFDCDPDNNDLEDHSGFGDLAAGFQYSFIYKPEENFIMTARLIYESTSGDDDVYQSNGDGNIAPAILFLKGWDKLQFSGTVGLVLPFDTEEESTMLYDAWHLSYAVTDWFRPLVELNHFHVLSAGSRDNNDVDDQASTVAAITTFNPGDIVNLGGENNDENRDLVTMALGARFRITKWFDIGAAYEFPLTDNKETFLDDRIYIDCMVTLNF